MVKQGSRVLSAGQVTTPGVRAAASDKTPTQTCCTTRVWIVIVTLCCVITITSLAVLIWREVHTGNLEDQVSERFPGFFRTVEQQFDFEQTFFNISSQYHEVNSSVEDEASCQVSCHATHTPKYHRDRRMAPGLVTFHACCQTITYFKSKSHLLNVYGEKKKIAQFHTVKQFFKFEQCQHVTNFQYGKCIQRYESATAVTEDPQRGTHDNRKYNIEWVQVPGCCKCINT
ncbi:uncharacterized protein LOC124291147 [Haliotis rubra]|uniref:uncharacterized protein LOC124291147 n=1 Tax=Haliotis rubra TaxID=36100 RepID=UPI001EE5DD20|nr:uncharacterized protein LOC124291147 [Haliotis rubra]XP_046584027.1 uncharacterized protein LOC124291147 [Haliotis rubra]